MESLGLQQEPRPADRLRRCDRPVQRDRRTGAWPGSAVGRALQRRWHADQAWASHKSLRRKDGSDDDQSPDDWRGQSRSNDTHASTSDPDSRLYRKSNGIAAQLCYLGHVLTDNRHGLVVNVRASQANGRAEREEAAGMLKDVAQPRQRITVGADKNYNTRGFVAECRRLNVTPHVARNTRRTGAPSTSAPAGTAAIG